MPYYCTVRFGGNNLHNCDVTSSVVRLLKAAGDDRYIIVVSAVCSVQDALSEAIPALLSSRTQPEAPISRIVEAIDSIAQLHGVHSPTVDTWVERLKTLLMGISYTGDCSPTLYDQIMSFAEKITAALFDAILQAQGVDSAIRLPEDIGLRVSDESGAASILTDESCITVRHAEFAPVSIVPGSYGITEKGKIVRLGHRAADYTAAALTYILNSTRLELWQIRKPFKTADDSIVPDADYAGRLTYGEASELSYFNCSGVFPRIVEPLAQYGIPIFIYDIAEGRKILRTTISDDSSIAPNVVKSVAHTDDIAILKLNGPGVGFKPGILARITTDFNNRRLNIRSVITAQTSINIIFDKSSIQQVRDICGKLDFDVVNNIEIADNVSLLAVAGTGMQSYHGVSARIFAAIEYKHINVLLSGSGASDLVSYIVVNRPDRDAAIREIHSSVFSSRK